MRRQRHQLVEQVLRPATSDAVMTWPAFAMSATFSLLIHLFASPEFVGQAIPFRVVAAVATVVPMFAVIALAQRTPHTHPRLRIVVVFGSYVIGGALRGWLLAQILTGAGLLQDSGADFRIPSSAIFMSSTTALFTYGWATYSNHRKTTARLRLETEALQAALTRLEEETQAQALEQLGRISTGIVRELQQLEVAPAGGQIDQIQRLLDEQVRPLSRTYAREVTTWSPSLEPVRIPRLRSVWRTLRPLDCLPSPWWNLIQAFAPVPTALTLFGGLDAIRVSLLLLVTLVPATWVLNHLARRWLRGRNTVVQAVCITIGYEVIAIIGGLASMVALSDTSKPTFYVATGLLSEPASAWVLIISRGLWREAVAQEQRIRAVHDELQWAIARVNLLAWYHRGVISRLLHGPIQNAMHAAVMRLRGSDPSTVVAGVIDELRARIATVEPSATGADQAALDLSVALADIQQLWHDIASIRIGVPEAVITGLRQDPASASIVLDLVQEICSNAVRHGGATSIDIDLQMGTRLVTLLISDDGSALGNARTAGVGSQFMNSCSISWQRTRISGRNHLLVTIPSSP